MNTSIPHYPVVVIGGGQSGLAAAGALRHAGTDPVVLEAGATAQGSWPDYYDSLKAFSPNRFNSMPGLDFGGNPDGYPTRDEVAHYLARYAESIGLHIRTDARVTEVTEEPDGFGVHIAGQQMVTANAVIAASGSFGRPNRPPLTGQDGFGGELLHVAEYRNPAPFAGKRVVVVGGGNSAVQVACELAEVATVTVASLEPFHLVPQQLNGRDAHHLLVAGFDHLPPHWLAQLAGGPLVMDVGGYAEMFASGAVDRRPMFSELTSDGVRWDDGETEFVDTVILATGYRPDLGYLRGLGALDGDAAPLHVGGLSTTHVGLGYIGLELQRSFASNTLRGVARDAEAIAPAIAAVANGAHRLSM
ncbi:putative flavoprotein involved in K+ transport [Stackebrandtia endophytica]|uniref:Putative flavoprotein involved in K+ transport n=1 Tax=Stackebrandtia endophytica TaxID=1496996 RepID=A0A543B2J6_9ACTN|nr:NAD(P)/FAD-dependent oxidoreductase [Stackebrandtia endophytica]TQL79051.1 putative flavoprotein involved in K+ transport [Stackebrandtia endophytica]